MVTYLAKNKSRSGLESWEAFGFKQLFSPFPGGSVVKNLAANAGDVGSIPASKISGEENGNPLQYSCLENPMDRGAWWVTVHGVAKESDMT